MALSYLSGMEDNFLGIAEVGKPKQYGTSTRAERYKAMLAKRRARMAARKARATEETHQTGRTRTGHFLKADQG